jgi:hypothetical protein
MRYLILCACLIGCDDAPPPAACLSGEPADCAPLYDPTFENVYTRTLEPSCAVGGPACHGPQGTAGNLQLVDQASAHAAIMQYVSAGDAACSPLSARLDGIGGDQMPPGAALDDAAKCAVRQWIANGAAP